MPAEIEPHVLKSPLIFYLTGHSGAVNGEWYAFPRPKTTHIPLAISLQAGTATWAIEGRNGPGDDVQTLDTGSADEAVSVLWMPQMRISLTESSGATLRATAGTPVKEIEYE